MIVHHKSRTVMHEL